MKNTILKFAFSTMLAVLLATMTAWAQDETYKYLDANGVEQGHTATVLDDASDFGVNLILGDWDQTTWYIVTGSINLSSELHSAGDVHLILADGAVLNVNVNVESGDGCYVYDASSLTIYSQSYGNDMGKMTVEGDYGFRTNNALTINGGFVTAKGASGDAIYGNFTFNGGKLVANTGSGIDANQGTVSLGYNSPDDYVQINQVYNGSVTIKDGQRFVTEGGDIAKGTISADDFNSKFGGKELKGFPYYISSVDDLKDLAKYVNEEGRSTEGMTFILTADIDFNPAEDESNNFTAIGTKDHPFLGTFDGGNDNGYTISGIRISASTYYQGLFGYVGEGATVKNVTIDNAKVSSTGEDCYFYGGIAGYNGGTIANCTSSAKVSSTQQRCVFYGGIVGSNYGKIATCTSSAKVSSTEEDCTFYGGIAGSNNGSIEYCTSSAKVSTTQQDYCVFYGGIAGKNDGSIEYCTSSAKVSSTGKNCDFYGGIAGSNGGTLSYNFVINAEINTKGFGVGAITGNKSGTLTDNYYYNCNVNEATTNVGCNGADIDGALPVYKLTLGEDVNITSPGKPTFTYGEDNYYKSELSLTFSIPDGSILFANGVQIPDAASYKMPAENVEITAVKILEIKTPEQLVAFAESVNGGYNYKGELVILANDIKFSTNGQPNFTAIGTDEHHFLGTFDGGNDKGYTISGIRISASTKYQGLFGYVGEDATVKNVTIDNMTISSTGKECDLYGGIAGINKGTIANCTSSAVVSSTGEKCTCYGGIAGGNYGTIANCTSSAEVSSIGQKCGYYGGIAGSNDGTIEYCTSSAKVSSSETTCDNYGGIAGGNYAKLSNNFVTNAEINAINDFGAIVGRNYEGGFLSHNYYYNCEVNDVITTGVGCKGADIFEADGAAPALIIDGNSEATVSVSAGENKTVVYLRNFTAGIPTTIILPFVFKASDFSNETFYYFAGINTETWTATMAADNQAENLSDNTPYIFTPSAETAARKYFVFNGVKFESPTAGYTEVTPWKFQGTYKYQSWNTNGNRDIKNIYGFAATSSTNTEGDDIAAGEFVRAGLNARIRPTRAYLEYTGTEKYLLSKSAIELPDRIKVVFIDKETSSVIDDPAINPSDPNGDIPTPTSELNPAANVKVWSYDKTIYIASRPGTDYSIIDVNGRLLKESTTQTDRDEVRLGSRSGIVVVIIGNKAFKIRY